MARLFTDGAESGDVLAFTSTSGFAFSSTTPGRIGGRYYNANGGAGIKVIGAVSEFYVRIAFDLISFNNNCRLNWFSGASTELGSIRLNTTTHCLDLFTSTGTLRVSGTFALLTGTWYVLELHVKIDDSGGVLEFKIDGVLQTGFSGDTKPGADTTIDRIRFGGSSGLNGDQFGIDDIAVNDTAGSVDNSWCGDAHLYALTPNADGASSQLLGSDGNSVNNYLLVDEIPSNGDTDYVESAMATQYDLYGLTDLPALPSGSTVARVVVESRARELTAAADAINLGVKQGSTEGWSSNIVVGTSYARQVAEFLVNPDTGIAWTESEVNSMQAGVKIV